MSLARQLSQGIQKKKINIREIRENPLNFYTIKEMDIEKVMRSMLAEGQLENVIVYEDESPDDGRKYTLLSGTTRFRAIQRINDEHLQNEFCDGLLRADIYSKPKSDLIENRIIRDANLQREKSPADMYQEILSCEEEIKFIRSRNPDAYQGRKTRDIVGEMLGITGRSVDNRKKAFLKLEDTGENSVSQQEQEPQLKVLSEKEIIGLFKKSQRQYEKMLGRWEENPDSSLDKSLGDNLKKILNEIYEVMNIYE